MTRTHLDRHIVSERILHLTLIIYSAFMLYASMLPYGS